MKLVCRMAAAISKSASAACWSPKHSVGDQGQIDLSQPRRRRGQHLRMGRGVIQIHDPGIHRERTPRQKVLGYGGQAVVGFSPPA